ncbi:MAG TPA: ABC transporter permease [Pyrinomonadaceae bacterium]|jgi:oligopeptide transport system permease protein|nr:ABC transporter permease [Pyrinomonadaceae bacterium]
MSEERMPKVPTEEGREPGSQWDAGEPALTPEGTPQGPPVRARRGNEIHAFPETAVGEGDVRGAEDGGAPARGTSLWRDAWRRLLKNKLAVFGMVVVGLIIVAVLVGPYVIKATTGFEYFSVPTTDVERQSFPPFTAPDGTFSWTHPMGTDIFGRDMLTRVLQGGRISLMVGIIATLVSLLIGIAWGATAGYLGGKIDDVMMRIVDVLYAIPYMMIVIVLLAFFGGQTPLKQIFLLFAALGAVSWLTMARIVRGQIISLKNQEFVLAARATGVSTPKIIFRHLVPNALGPVIVYATLTIPSVMLQEAFLSFLGLGVQAPYASWGSLAQEGIQNIAIFPWQLIFPGVTMALTLFSLNFLGDGLRDALDPQMRKF